MKALYVLIVALVTGSLMLGVISLLSGFGLMEASVVVGVLLLAFKPSETSRALPGHSSNTSPKTC